MSPLLQIFSYALIPTAAMALAGAVGAFRTPGEKLRSAILHAAGGIVFAAVSLEFLPAIVHEHATWATVVGFGLGAAISLGLRSFFKKLGVESTETAPTPKGTKCPTARFGTAAFFVGFLDYLVLEISGSAAA